MFRCLSTSALGFSGRTSEVIELALSNGFKGLELDIVDFAETVKSSDLAKARRLIDSAKLKLGVFALPVDWQHDETQYRIDLSKLADYAKLAVEVGCTRAVTTILPGSDERPLHQNFDFYRKRLMELAGVLEPLGVMLGVNFAPAIEQREGYAFEFISDLDVLMMLMSMAPAKGLGYVVDLWNVRAGGGSLDTLKKIPAAKVIAVNLADALEDLPAKQWPLKNRVLPQESPVIDNVSLLTWLGEIGYDGPVMPAPDASTLAGQRREQIFKSAGERLDSVWKAAGLNPQGKLTAVGSKG